MSLSEAEQALFLPLAVAAGHLTKEDLALLFLWGIKFRRHPVHRYWSGGNLGCKIFFANSLLRVGKQL